MADDVTPFGRLSAPYRCSPRDDPQSRASHGPLAGPEDRAADNALVFMAKWPEPGRAKTRLCPPLTADDAAALARAFLLDTLAEAAGVDADRWVAFAPACSASAFHTLLGADVGLIEAEAPNLGGALKLAQRTALAHGYRRVALVASDLPHLDGRCYEQAFAALARADVTIGPSADGGYYLLAAGRETPHLFDEIRWSTDQVFAQTVRRAAEARLSIESIQPCDDIDTAADLEWLLDTLRCRQQGRRTVSILERLLATPSGPAGRRFGPLKGSAR